MLESLNQLARAELFYLKHLCLQSEGESARTDSELLESRTWRLCFLFFHRTSCYTELGFHVQ